jgi:hypothetical protein
MTPAAAGPDGHVLAARYEALRQNAMASGSCLHTVRGLALLMRQGMAAWMTSAREEPLRIAAIAVASPASPATRLPDGIERTLVDIVATMALATTLGGAT